MKKIKKLFFSLILFLFYANITNATTKGTYVVEENNTGKGLLVFIGIGLIILIIFLGYQLDKKDEIKKRREKYNKSDKNNNNNQNDEDDEIQYLEDIQVNNQTKVTQDTIMINCASLKKMEKMSIDYNKLNDEKYYEPQEEVIEEDIKIKPEKKSDKKVQIDSTMELKEIEDAEEIEEVEDIVEPEIFKNIEEKEIKDYEKIDENEDLDIDEDLELLELEKTIKAANIRRYTRKKKKNVKRYTRKKIRVEPETRKRGRPAKIKTEDSTEMPKRGRGRPRKTESIIINKVPKKRGRPAKVKTEDSVEMPKRGRGRPRKN